MADVDFRVKFPWNSATNAETVTVGTETPTFTQLIELDITEDLPAGEYVLTVVYEWSMPDTNDSGLIRVISPVTSGDVFSQEPKDNSDVQLRTFAQAVNWSGGAINFSLQGAVSIGGNNMTVSFSQLTFERKA